MFDHHYDFRMATLLAQHKFEEAEAFANKFKLDLEVQLILVIWLFNQSINQSSVINHDRSINQSPVINHDQSINQSINQPINQPLIGCLVFHCVQLVYKRKVQVLNDSLVRASSKERKEEDEKEEGESVRLRDSLLHCLNKIKVHLF